jgi:hypothetical protein
MKIMKVLFILLCTTVFSSSFAQNNEIYTIKLDIQHSRRIPHNHVSIDLERYGDDIHVHVKSIPKDTVSLEWKSTSRDYLFELTFAEFEKVVSAVKKINCTDIVNGLDVCGFDGITCQIEIGGIGNSITYKVWSPEYQTKERSLQSFLDACILILETSKLGAEKIL